MTEYTRRTKTAAVLLSIVALSLLIVGPVGASAVDGAATSVQDSDETAEYAVVQGDDCVPIEPIGNGSQTVEEFYDYRTPETDPSAYTYSSHGTAHLQEDDTSILFLHEGSEGTSLVLVHGHLEGDGTGNAVTMEFDGLPEDGSWPVEDDSYSEDLGAGPFDEFEHEETSSQISWTSRGNRTDGAAFRGGLDDEFEISITPAFNDDAEVQQYDGTVTDWQVLSGSERDPERTSLEMDEPIVIQSGGCSSFDVTDVSIDDPVSVGTSTTVEATVEQTGPVAETITVPFAVDGDTVDEQEVTLESGETTTLSTSVEFDEAGTATVSVGDRVVEVTVEEDDERSISDEVPGFGVPTAVLAALAITLFVRYRR